MSNPYIQAGEALTHSGEALTHGLEGETGRWVRRVVKRGEKKLTDEHKSNHAITNDNELPNEARQFSPGLMFEQLFGEAWQNADRPVGEQAALYQFAERAALDELKRSLDTNAMLKLAPDDFMRLHDQMQQIAREMVNETRNLAAAEKTPIGMNVFREKVKSTVHKYVGNVRDKTSVQIQATEQKQASALPTLASLCSHFNFEIKLPTLPLPFSNHS